MLYGGDGDDTIDPGFGNDTAYGGAGTDTLDFGLEQATREVESNGRTLVFGAFVELQKQNQRQDTGAGQDQLSGFENLSGSKFNDVFFGDANDNRLEGRAGSDFLSGDAGNDMLLGGEGADLLVGGEGADVFYGGDNGGRAIETDIVSYSDVASELVFGFGENFSQFDQRTSASIQGDVINTDVEGIVGSRTASNTFHAEGISTTIYLEGGPGNDTFFGGSGTDQLLGGKGDDILYGNHGIDALIGGAGNDSLYGGAGPDTFIFETSEGDRDTIFDFEPGVDLVFLAFGAPSIPGFPSPPQRSTVQTDESADLEVKIRTWDGTNFVDQFIVFKDAGFDLEDIDFIFG